MRRTIASSVSEVKLKLVNPAIPHPRLRVREIVSPGAPEAVGQFRIRFVGRGRAGKYTRGGRHYGGKTGTGAIYPIFYPALLLEPII